MQDITYTKGLILFPNASFQHPHQNSSSLEMSGTTQLQVLLVLDGISNLLTEDLSSPHISSLLSALGGRTGQKQALKEAQGTEHCLIPLPPISTKLLQFCLLLGPQTQLLQMSHETRLVTML